MSGEIWALSARAIAEKMSAGEISSVEATRAHLERIDAVDARIRAFTMVFREHALAAAERADEERRRGQARGPLHGLPMSIKECFDVEGHPTTLGIGAWRTRVAASDAAMVTMLREAGAVILGRTNLSQTMLYVEARNPVYGQTANPFSSAHTPGGSSGGEAAAIAAGMSPLGVGTDIGGSIRTPCHFSGICGIKPTLDRLVSKGQRTALAGQEVVRSMAGPMARSVADLTMFLRALDTRAMSALDPRVPPIVWEDPSSVDVKKLRVGFYADDGVVAPSRAVARGVARAVEVLAHDGWDVVPFTPPGVVDAIYDYLAALSSDGGKTAIRAIDGGEVDPVMKPFVQLARVPGPVRRALAHAAKARGEARFARMLFAMGEKSVAELWALTDRLRAYRATVLDAMRAANVDVLVCPAYATPALPHGASKNFSLASSYSMLWNLTQFPAGVVPVTRVRVEEADRILEHDMVEKHAKAVDQASGGLPVGVQVVGRPWQEAAVLAVMGAIEAGVAGAADMPRVPVYDV